MTARAFTAAEARQIVALRNKRWSIAQLTDRFGHEETIVRILSGRAYRDVLHVVLDGVCECPSCVINKRAEENDTRAQAAIFAAVCVNCGHPVAAKVAQVLRHPNQVQCDFCDGRKG